MTRAHVALAALVAILPAARGQTTDEVIALHKAGLSEETIRTQIDVTGTRYALSPAELISLKEAGVPESLIQAMIRTAQPVAAATHGATGAAVDPGLARQIGEVRRALAEPRYSGWYGDAANDWYWDDFPVSGYGGYYPFGYPVIGFAHLGSFAGSAGGFRGHHGHHGHGFSPGFRYHHGNFSFSFGTHFSGGRGSSFRFRSR